MLLEDQSIFEEVHGVLQRERSIAKGVVSVFLRADGAALPSHRIRPKLSAMFLDLDGD